MVWKGVTPGSHPGGGEGQRELPAQEEKDRGDWHSNYVHWPVVDDFKFKRLNLHQLFYYSF